MDFNVDINRAVVMRSLVWKTLERLFSQGINLIVQIILARLLLPTDFASLAIIAAIINYASIFVQTGLATTIIQKKGVDSKDISTLLTSSLVIALLFYVILFISAPYIAEYYHIEVLDSALKVLALILFLNAINAVQTAILSKKMQFMEQFVRTALAVTISGGIGIYLAYKGYGVWALIVHNIVNVSVLIVLMSFMKDTRIRLGFSWRKFKELYSFSIKILGGGLVAGLHDTLRTIVIGKKYSPDALAYYDKAYTYSMYATSIVNSSLSSVLLPTFSNKQDSKEAVKNMARRSINLSAFVMFPFLLAIAAMAKPLIIVLLTNKWASSIPFLVVFCILRLPTGMTSIDKQVYYALGNSSIGLYYEVALLLLNLISLCITVPISPMAIAIGATIVEFIGTIALSVVSSKFYGYSLKERVHDLLPQFISATLMAAAIYLISFLPLNYKVMLVIQCVAAVICYLALARVFDKDNFMFVFSEVKRIYGKIKKVINLNFLL